MLSVVANSAVVEVWTITPALMEIMPTTVQNVILERLQAKKKVKVHQFDESQQDMTEKMKKVYAAQQEAKQRYATNQFRYEYTGAFVKEHRLT